jgi:hypothetical protein
VLSLQFFIESTQWMSVNWIILYCPFLKWSVSGLLVLAFAVNADNASAKRSIENVLCDFMMLKVSQNQE